MKPRCVSLGLLQVELTAMCREQPCCSYRMEWRNHDCTYKYVLQKPFFVMCIMLYQSLSDLLIVVTFLYRIQVSLRATRAADRHHSIEHCQSMQKNQRSERSERDAKVCHTKLLIVPNRKWSVAIIITCQLMNMGNKSCQR